jgi:hypothetical protein
VSTPASSTEQRAHRRNTALGCGCLTLLLIVLCAAIGARAGDGSARARPAATAAQLARAAANSAPAPSPTMARPTPAPSPASAAPALVATPNVAATAGSRATAQAATAAAQATAAANATRGAAEAAAVAHLGAGNTLLAARNVPAALNEYATAQALAPWRDDVRQALANGRAAATATARPTPIPPTATPETMPEADRRYAAAMAPIIATVTSSMKDLAEESGEVSAQPYLLRDQDWELRTAATLAVLSTAADELEAGRQAPPDMAEVERLSERLGRELNAAVSDYADGVDHLDVDSINSASEHISNANTLMQQATQQLRAIALRYGE